MYFLPAVSKEQIQNEWKKTLTLSSFSRLVTIVQQYITVRLYSGENLDTVFTAASILGWLHDINKKKVLPYIEFYNDVGNSEINLIQDYYRSSIYSKRSKERNDRQRSRVPPHVESPKELSELSFCEFFFLLDAASKSNIYKLIATFNNATKSMV